MIVSRTLVTISVGCYLLLSKLNGDEEKVGPQIIIIKPDAVSFLSDCGVKF